MDSCHRIIQWSFEDLLRSSYVADYLELFQELLWPSGKSSKSLATFAMNADPVQLQQAATQSIVDAIPSESSGIVVFVRLESYW